MKFFYTISFILFFLLSGKTVFGQTNIQTLSPNPVTASEGSFLNPSYLKDTRGFELNVGPFMGLDIGLTNNFVSFGNLMDFIRESGEDNATTNYAPSHEILNNIGKKNAIELHSNFTLLNANFRVGAPEKAIHVGLSVRHHIHSNFTINEEFFSLFLKGNKQYAGATINLSPEVSAISYTDIGVAASKTLKVGDLTITPGIRLRYLLGTGSIYSGNTHLNLYTAADGSYIEVNGQVDGYAGGIINGDSLVNGGEPINTDNIGQALGKGIAVDLGATVQYKNLSLSIASIDNGSIHFDDQHGWHLVSQNVNVRWEGYEFGEGKNGTDFSQEFKPFDSLDVRAVSEGFSTTIGSKITLNANYGLIHQTDKKGYEYYKHNFGINYIQGFKNKYDASTSPKLSLYYQLNLGNRFTAGANYIHYRNINDLGFNVGLRVGGMKIALGTNSLFAVIDRYASKQANVFFLWGFAF